MRLPWSKPSRDVAKEDAADALIKELEEGRKNRMSPQDALAEMIKIGNRDVGIEPGEPAATAPKSALPANAAPEPQVEAALESTDAQAQVAQPAAESDEGAATVEAAAQPEESLSGLSLEELVGLLGGAEPEQKQAG